MPRRELLTSAQREALLAFPKEEADLLQGFTPDAPIAPGLGAHQSDRRLRVAFEQAGGQGPISTLAKPKRFNDASVYATTWSLACFIFRFVHGRSLSLQHWNAADGIVESTPDPHPIFQFDSTTDRANNRYGHL